MKKTDRLVERALELFTGDLLEAIDIALREREDRLTKLAKNLRIARYVYKFVEYMKNIRYDIQRMEAEEAYYEEYGHEGDNDLWWESLTEEEQWNIENRMEG